MSQIEVEGKTIRKVRGDEPLEEGWRNLTIEEAYQYKERLNELLEEWSIVGVSAGKIDGFGYGNVISESSGGECGEKFIVSP